MAFTEPRQFQAMEEALSALFGKNVQIVESRRVTGGDVNEACKLTLTNGKQIFVKRNAMENADIFVAETVGLLAIAATGTIRIPDILGTGIDRERGCSFLLMEYIESGSRGRDFWKTFGRQLADMHRAPTDELTAGGKFGFVMDNYIGIRKQKNDICDSWTAFFRDCRLAPQFEAAYDYFDRTERKKITGLLDRVGDVLVEPTHPSLLHGDLWAGNFMTGTDGRGWLIDPAAYVGHAEADIAMTELFGGFSQSFYDAYREAATVQPGYEERRDLYNLYHLLNHLNMFGVTYLSGVKRILKKYMS